MNTITTYRKNLLIFHMIGKHYQDTLPQRFTWTAMRLQRVRYILQSQGVFSLSCGLFPPQSSTQPTPSPASLGPALPAGTQLRPPPRLISTGDKTLHCRMKLVINMIYSNEAAATDEWIPSSPNTVQMNLYQQQSFKHVHQSSMLPVWITHFASVLMGCTPHDSQRPFALVGHVN